LRGTSKQTLKQLCFQTREVTISARPGTAGVCIYPEVEPHRSKQKQLVFSKLGTLFYLMLRQGTPRTVKQTALLLNLVNYDI
jgi:hypothetical protein